MDWRDEANWGCNDGVHPSRHGTYDGISMHPFETVFLKASWDVGQPHLERYTRWLGEHAEVVVGVMLCLAETLSLVCRWLWEHAKAGFQRLIYQQRQCKYGVALMFRMWLRRELRGRY